MKKVVSIVLFSILITLSGCTPTYHLTSLKEFPSCAAMVVDERADPEHIYAQSSAIGYPNMSFATEPLLAAALKQKICENGRLATLSVTYRIQSVEAVMILEMTKSRLVTKINLVVEGEPLSGRAEAIGPDWGDSVMAAIDQIVVNLVKKTL